MVRTQELKYNIENQAPVSVKEQTLSSELCYGISSNDTFKLLSWLKTSTGCQFDQLIDITVVDYIHYGQSEWKTQNSNTGYSRGTSKVNSSGHPEVSNCRFVVVHQLLSTELNWRLRIHSWVQSNPAEIDSAVSIWPSANWLEREAYDLFGVVFKGHPDLRRILTDYGFKGYPFRKDFPLVGFTEMRYDAAKERVIYQPVSIENRVTVPKTIRDDSRYVPTESRDAND